jgi:hypothetical protein
MILAVVNGPQPTMANNDAAIRVTRLVISVASSSISAASAVLVLPTRRRRAELCARANEQHRWVMQGDDWGVFGDYPAASL